MSYKKVIKNFVISTLKSFHKDIEKVFNENQETFIEAFTHKSIIGEVNYENLETIGDGIIEGVFYNYMAHNGYKKFNPESLSLLRKNYVSMIFLAKISRMYGLDRIMRTNIKYEDLSEKEISDVVESFVGAITIAFDLSVAKGYGYVISYQWFTSILDKEDFVINDKTTFSSLKDAVSKLKQYYEFHNYGNVIYQNSSINGKFISIIKKGKDIIGKGESKIVSQDAKEKAAENALEYFGVTDEILSSYKKNELYNNKLIKEFMKRRKIQALNLIIDKLDNGKYKAQIKGDKDIIYESKGITRDIAVNNVVNQMLNL